MSIHVYNNYILYILNKNCLALLRFDIIYAKGQYGHTWVNKGQYTQIVRDECVFFSLIGPSEVTCIFIYI